MKKASATRQNSQQLASAYSASIHNRASPFLNPINLFAVTVNLDVVLTVFPKLYPHFLQRFVDAALYLSSLAAAATRLACWVFKTFLKCYYLISLYCCMHSRYFGHEKQDI